MTSSPCMALEQMEIGYRERHDAELFFHQATYDVGSIG